MGILPHQYGLRSDVGTVRTLNEDAAMLIEFHPGGDARRAPVVLAVVADGMGGHAAGEVASHLAVETIARMVQQDITQAHPTRRELARALSRAIAEANANIYWHAQAHPESRGMGTTLTAALLAGRHLCVGHIGDSRAYLLHGHALRQLTHDQTVVQQKIDAGILTPAEARRSEERNQLLKALGIHEQIDPALAYVEMQVGDTLVLSSDGLHGALAPEELAYLVAQAPDPQTACDSLVAHANERDGADNLTAVCLRYQTPSLLRFARARVPQLLLAVVLLIIGAIGLHALHPESGMSGGGASIPRKQLTVKVADGILTINSSGGIAPVIVLIKQVRCEGERTELASKGLREVKDLTIQLAVDAKDKVTWMVSRKRDDPIPDQCRGFFHYSSGSRHKSAGTSKPDTGKMQVSSGQLGKMPTHVMVNILEGKTPIELHIFMDEQVLAKFLRPVHPNKIVPDGGEQQKSKQQNHPGKSGTGGKPPHNSSQEGNHSTGQSHTTSTTGANGGNGQTNQNSGLTSTRSGGSSSSSSSSNGKDTTNDTTSND